MRPVTILLAFTLLGGCVWGTRPKDVHVAVNPTGARVTLHLRDGSPPRYGELYLVDSAGLVVRDERLVRIPWARIRQVDVMAISHNFDIYDVARMDPVRERRLRLVSRFPYGLSGPVLAQVLAAVNQDSVEVLP